MENTPPTAETEQQADLQSAELSAADPQQYRRVLRDLVAIGLEQARTLHQETRSQTPTAASLSSAVEAYVRIAGAIRSAIILSEILADPTESPDGRAELSAVPPRQQ
jgi:hypothetical protein